MPKKIRTLIVTGGAGFIGSEFVRQGAHNGYRIIVVDKLTYASDRARLQSVAKKITFHKVDINNRTKMAAIIKNARPDAVVHFAAETHVDRSIHEVTPFITTNVSGTQTLIDLCRAYRIPKFIHISTDEIYGESKKGLFIESSPVQPNNPYAATKAAAELLIRAAIRTYQFPAIIVRPANTYGPWQYPEKLIPVVILHAQAGRKVPVYGRGKHVREWLHVSDCSRAVYRILEKGTIGEAYNIGTYQEAENIKTVSTILHVLGKDPRNCIQFVTDRPGHDFRYSVDHTKLTKLGWDPSISFLDGIKETVAWYLANQTWTLKKLTATTSR